MTRQPTKKDMVLIFHSEFKVMSFGLTNAPTTFQCAMNSTLQPYLRKFALVFFMTYSRSWEEHLKHLEMVLATLQQTPGGDFGG